LLEQPYHKAAGDTACSACHDPHMAGNRLLLVDSGSYKRRRVDRRPGVEHAPWRERKCTLCHLPEQSNAMVANLDAVCLSCHAKVLEGAPPKKLHKAVEEKHCVVCHAPHRSPLPALVRTNAEQMCYACHKVEETRKPGHPPVERADCLLCHKGHASEREHLLRTDIVWPPAPDAKTGGQATAGLPSQGGGTAGPGP
jgi:predicted CXXCH cytochrome family protein